MSDSQPCTFCGNVHTNWYDECAEYAAALENAMRQRQADKRKEEENRLETIRQTGTPVGYINEYALKTLLKNNGILAKVAFDYRLSQEPNDVQDIALYLAPTAAAPFAHVWPEKDCRFDICYTPSASPETFPIYRSPPAAPRVETPTEEGWYWLFCDDTWSIEHVFYRPGHEYLAVQTPDDNLYGKRNFLAVAKLKGAWFGPITKPEL